ncbi:MAG: hypothetical protein AB1758_08365 [Candidatus Eremiobacterota bacterium]
MESAISPAFARLLEARRERFNSAFAQARRSRRALNGADFLDHLRVSVDPVVAALGDSLDLEKLVEALYDLSLELVGTEVLGPRSRFPQVATGWGRLLPRLGPLLVRHPRQVTASITNALTHLSRFGRPDEWIDSMSELGPGCPDLPTLLKLGQVLAWRAGLAHYREAALALWAELPVGLARAAMGVAPEPALVRAMTEDPWLKPGAPVSSGELRVVGRLGSFRGFGGPFIAPPTVRYAGGHLFHVTDGEEDWLLAADCYGACLHRSSPPPQTKEPRGCPKLPEALGAVKSRAVAPRTVAVTKELSHAVFLLA